MDVATIQPKFIYYTVQRCCHKETNNNIYFGSSKPNKPSKTKRNETKRQSNNAITLQSNNTTKQLRNCNLQNISCVSSNGAIEARVRVRVVH
mmetsp:Transcript_19373/g.40698  ORF Transcript_19373/g.40698 Transcript_19373/m.40698 type:complete len:92 (+) Transcript_19373:139-414(+)